jgi:hypothetical protein
LLLTPGRARQGTPICPEGSTEVALPVAIRPDTDNIAPDLPSAFFSD